VATAYRVEASIARLVEDRPEVVIVDPAIGEGAPADLVAGYGGYTDSPLLVLADIVDEAVVVAALDAGAVDVIGRPSGPWSCWPRVASAARRSRGGPADPGGPPRRAAGRPRAARRQRGRTDRRPHPDLELDLLAAMAARRGGVVDHRLLVRAAWPDPAGVDVETLRTHLARLNAKLIEAGHPGLRNVRSRGYALRVEGSDEPGT